MINQRNSNAHEVNNLLASNSSLSQNQELLSNDRQHFDIDTIELIQTDPRSTLSQATKQFPHHLVIYLIRAVKHYTLDSHCLRQIFTGLSLASSSRTGRSTTQLESVGPRQREPTSIRQRSDHQTTRGTHVFITIGHGGIRMLDLTIIHLRSPVVS